MAVVAAMEATSSLEATTGKRAGRLHPSEIRREFAARAGTTPGRLTLFMVIVGALAGLAGLTTVVGSAERANQVEQVADHSGPLTVQAQQLYRSLSDADATAAAAFLSSGAEPADLRDRYSRDIAAASSALAAATANRDSGDGRGAAEVDQIAQSLPVYTGLVETALYVQPAQPSDRRRLPTRGLGPDA